MYFDTRNYGSGCAQIMVFENEVEANTYLEKLLSGLDPNDEYNNCKIEEDTLSSGYVINVHEKNGEFVGTF